MQDFDVRDYGAIGDGVADDTQAVQAATDAAVQAATDAADAAATDAADAVEGGAVHFPAGVYRIVGPIIIRVPATSQTSSSVG